MSDDGVAREPLDVLVVGSGFSGLYSLYRLRRDGYNVRIAESSTGIGGVWQNNRYPGARVDSHVPNYEFSLEEVWRDWTWSERFPGRDELVAYFEHVANELDLWSQIDLETRVTRAHYDESTKHWDVDTSSAQRYRCRFLVLCTGFGSAPYIPNLAGLDDFGAVCHHTAKWPAGGVQWEGQRVGVVGTGASGVQVIQEAARVAGRLSVFQRTPVTAIPMRQKRLTRVEQDAAKPHYAEVFRRRNAPPTSFFDLSRRSVSALEVSALERRVVFEQEWSKGGFHFWVGTFRDILTNAEANRTAYDFWREKVRARIDDSDLHELLAPTEPPYPFGTKRPSLEQNYYECFNQPNVELFDIRSDPIERVTQTGVRLVSSRHVDLDVLVLATGFDSNTGGLTAIDLRGRNARSLAQTWSSGVDTHLGVAVHGFPNMLMLYGPQSSASFCNGPVCAEIQGDWVADFLNRLRTDGQTEFESSREHGLAWTAWLAELAETTLFGRTDSWYMGANIPGKKRQLLNVPHSDAYLERLEACARNGYDGFALR